MPRPGGACMTNDLVEGSVGPTSRGSWDRTTPPSASRNRPPRAAPRIVGHHEGRGSDDRLEVPTVRGHRDHSGPVAPVQHANESFKRSRSSALPTARSPDVPSPSSSIRPRRRPSATPWCPNGFAEPVRRRPMRGESLSCQPSMESGGAWRRMSGSVSAPRCPTNSMVLSTMWVETVGTRSVNSSHPSSRASENPTRREHGVVRTGCGRVPGSRAPGPNPLP